ncbi:MAG: amino acid permease [Bdellovibrionales bacterium]|nr:amino acid permease [Bdellovibrionales bacterium]
MKENTSQLSRRLTLNDAIFLGLGSMIGAGIFAAAAPAAKAAGSGLLFAIAIAGTAAYFNATSMAQLAARYPESGGTYVYGRNQLGPLWGYLAGWGFVIGKIASCTAMALTFGYYFFPQYAHVVAVATVIFLTTVNYFGVKKTARVTRILVAIVLSTLIVLVVGLWLGGEAQVSRITQGVSSFNLFGVLEASGLMFFAFAGYARVATLGEEVVNPKSTIPKAILWALGITIGIYFIVVGSTLLVLPVEVLANSPAPLAVAIEQTRFSELAPLVRIGAAVASLSVLLSLIAGISRTVFAMARQKDLPFFLSSIHSRYKTPDRAEILVGSVVAFIVGFADMRMAIGFSSFAILIYYAIANLSALTLTKADRFFPKIFALLGLIICIVLAANLPLMSVLSGSGVFTCGIIWFYLRRRFQ